MTSIGRKEGEPTGRKPEPPTFRAAPPTPTATLLNDLSGLPCRRRRVPCPPLPSNSVLRCLGRRASRGRIRICGWDRRPPPDRNSREAACTRARSPTLRIGRDSQWDTTYQLMKYECLAQWVIVSAFATEAPSGMVGAEGHYLIARVDRQGASSNPSPRQSLFNHLNHAMPLYRGEVLGIGYRQIS